VGYLLYPINFFVWAYLLKEPAARTELLLGAHDTSAGVLAPGQR
jgi:hypothetical protein